MVQPQQKYNFLCKNKSKICIKNFFIQYFILEKKKLELFFYIFKLFLRKESRSSRYITNCKLL